MAYDGIFSAYSVPEPLSKEELYDCLKKCASGDDKAREKAISHNIRLVFYLVIYKFYNTPYERDDLISIGLIGLIKAVDTFNIERKVEFSTYATECINNEILMFIRKGQKHKNYESLDQVICSDKDGNILTLGETIEEDTDFVEEYIRNEILLLIGQIVNLLEGRDKEIIMLRYGFIDDKVYKQHEVASKFGIKQSHISRIESRILKKIRKELEKEGMIETACRVRKKKINS